MTTSSKQKEERKNAHPYFSSEYIKACTGFKWWEKVLLFFVPEYVAVDAGKLGKNYAVFYKTIFGRVYITKTEKL